MEFLENCKRDIINYLSWSHRKRRFLVIESDDWGATRMVSRAAFQYFQRKGYPVDECPYNTFDSLETAGDLNRLGEVLSLFRDQHERPAVLTANMIMANPDFSEIERSHFEKYSFQPFWQTLEQYGYHSAIATYRQVARSGVLRAQLHGREHVAFSRWLQRLRCGESALKEAFALQMYTVHTRGTLSGRRLALDAWGFHPTERGFNELPKVLADAQSLFREFWGFSAESVIAPCYTWHTLLNRHLSNIGVRILQSARVQRTPREDPEARLGRLYHFTGQYSGNGQTYLVRNVSLEPSAFPKHDVVDRAISEVDAAFRFGAPAIVQSHRVNYVGTLHEENRDRGLRTLRSFLKKVQARWPDVEFLSSDALGNVMHNT